MAAWLQADVNYQVCLSKTTKVWLAGAGSHCVWFWPCLNIFALPSPGKLGLCAHCCPCASQNSGQRRRWTWCWIFITTAWTWIWAFLRVCSPTALLCLFVRKWQFAAEFLVSSSSRNHLHSFLFPLGWSEWVFHVIYLPHPLVNKGLKTVGVSALPPGITIVWFTCLNHFTYVNLLKVANLNLFYSGHDFNSNWLSSENTIAVFIEWKLKNKRIPRKSYSFRMLN